MHLNRNLFGALAFCAVLYTPLASWAAVTVVTTQAAFNALVGVSGEDKFDDLLVERPVSFPASRPAGPFSYSAGAPPDGLYAFPGQLSLLTAANSLVLSNFTAGVHGFGATFFAQDLAGLPKRGQLTFMYNGSTIGDPLDIQASDTLGLFVGFVFGSAIDSGSIAIFSNVLDFPGVYLAIDNLTLASAVPELGTFPLIVVGAGALVAASLRRRRVA